MKRWAVLVVFVYFLILVALTSPMLLAAFYPQMKAHDSLGVFSEWMYWAGLGVMIVGQAVMLLIPVDLAMQRPTTRRPVLWPLLASGLMVGVLGAGAGASILEFIRRDNALDLVGKGVPLLAVIVPVWAVWSIVFYRTGRGAAAMDVITRTVSLSPEGERPGTARRHTHPHRGPRAALLLRGCIDLPGDSFRRVRDALFLRAERVLPFRPTLEAVAASTRAGS